MTHRRTEREPFRLLLADPAWLFGDKLPGKGRGATKHYPTLTLPELVLYPQPPMAKDAVLLLWRVAAMTAEAFIVASAWGFTPKAEIVWVKTTRGVAGQLRKGRSPTYRDHDLHFGMGRYTRGSHETCMVCTRGKASGLVKNHNTRSVFFAPVGAHSVKPDAFYELVEALFEGPNVEIFARKRRADWTQYGLELPGGEIHP